MVMVIVVPAAGASGPEGHTHLASDDTGGGVGPAHRKPDLEPPDGGMALAITDSTAGLLGRHEWEQTTAHGGGPVPVDRPGGVKKRTQFNVRRSHHGVAAWIREGIPARTEDGRRKKYNIKKYPR